MCHFISWIRHADGVYFLTDDELKTEKGKKLKEHLDYTYWDDVIGHGAIGEYYKFKRYEGIHEEITYLTNPTRLPIPIVEAIKAGKFRLIGKPEEVRDLLTNEATYDYQDAHDEILKDELHGETIAYDDYEETRVKSWKRYRKTVKNSKDVCETHYADYEFAKISGKIDPELLLDMEKTLTKIYKHSRKIQKDAEVKRARIEQEGYRKYTALSRKIESDSMQKMVNLFWDVFKNIDNRQPIWR